MCSARSTTLDKTAVDQRYPLGEQLHLHPEIEQITPVDVGHWGLRLVLVVVNISVFVIWTVIGLNYRHTTGSRCAVRGAWYSSLAVIRIKYIGFTILFDQTTLGRGDLSTKAPRVSGLRNCCWRWRACSWT